MYTDVKVEKSKNNQTLHR